VGCRDSKKWKVEESSVVNQSSKLERVEEEVMDSE
jgi:hypothetical protein